MSSTKRMLMVVGIVGGFAAIAMAQQDAAVFATARQYQTGANGFKDMSWAAGNQFEAAPPNSPILPVASNDPNMNANVPVIYLEPQSAVALPAPLSNSNSPPATPANTWNINLWVQVAAKYAGANSEQLLSSLGLNVTSACDTSTASPIPGVGATSAVNGCLATINRRGFITPTLTLFTTPATTNGAGSALWDGTNIVTPPLTDARMVTVPDSVGDFANGAVPAAGVATGAAGSTNSTVSYRFGQLQITAQGPAVTSNNGCRGLRPTRYNLTFANGNVLTTRVVNPAFAGALSAERISYGYAAGVPDVATSGGGCAGSPCGSVAGATTTTPDAAVEVRWKGDFDGNGVVNNSDISGFNNALAGSAAASPRVRFTGDFDNNGVVNNSDISGFNARLSNMGTGTPIPACP